MHQTAGRIHWRTLPAIKKAALKGGLFRGDGQRRLISINMLIAKNAKLGRIAPRIGGRP